MWLADENPYMYQKIMPSFNDAESAEETTGCLKSMRNAILLLLGSSTARIGISIDDSPSFSFLTSFDQFYTSRLPSPTVRYVLDSYTFQV